MKRTKVSPNLLQICGETIYLTRSINGTAECHPREIFDGQDVAEEVQPIKLCDPQDALMENSSV